MKYIKIVVLSILIISCQKRNNKLDKEVIARVNDKYLYEEDIKDLVPENASVEDSTHIINSYINVWATKQLFIDQAKRNLADIELKKFDVLVEDYKNTLYINAYKDAVINRSINLEVTEQDLKSYYEENQRNFNLNEELVRLRYLHLPSDFDDIVATEQKFSRFNEDDKEELENKKLEYISYSFEDSLWVSLDRVLNKLPILKKENKEDLLLKEEYIQLQDTTGIYLIRFNEVLKRNETAPLDYIKSTVKQIVIGQRKRELIKNLEKDITKDAIKNKQFEVYKKE